MTIPELTVKLNRAPFMINEARARQVKLTFLLNLMGLVGDDMRIEEAQLLNARDALESIWARKMISEVLNLSFQEDEFPDLKGPNVSTVMPLQLLADDTNGITQRLVAFLRPDPKMLIKVEKRRTDTEPSVNIYQVVIEDGRGGGWNETFVTEDLLRAFLRGIRVTYAMSDLQMLLPDFGDNGPLKFSEQSAVQHLP
jgi:hypothetical protein